MLHWATGKGGEAVGVLTYTESWPSTCGHYVGLRLEATFPPTET